MFSIYRDIGIEGVRVKTEEGKDPSVEGLREAVTLLEEKIAELDKPKFNETQVRLYDYAASKSLDVITRKDGVYKVLTKSWRDKTLSVSYEDKALRDRGTFLKWVKDEEGVALMVTFGIIEDTDDSSLSLRVIV